MIYPVKGILMDANSYVNKVGKFYAGGKIVDLDVNETMEVFTGDELLGQTLMKCNKKKVVGKINVTAGRNGSRIELLEIGENPNGK